MKLISFPVPASFYLAYLPSTVVVEGFTFNVEPIVRTFDAQLAQLQSYIKDGSIPDTFSFFVPLLIALYPRFLSDNSQMNDAPIWTMKDELMKTELKSKDLGVSFFGNNVMVATGVNQFRGQMFSAPKNAALWDRVINNLRSNENFNIN